MIAFTDLHCHLIPDPDVALQHLPVVFGGSVGADEVLYHGASVGMIRRELTDPSACIEAMDRQGVHRRALSFAPLSYRYDLPITRALPWCRDMNDALAAACRSFPDRLLPIGTVPLQDPDAAAEEASRVVGELGMCAIEIGTSVAGRNLDDRAFDPFFRRVEQLGIAIFLHPEHQMNALWDDYYLVNLVGNPVTTGIAIARLMFGGVTDRFPALRFWTAHAGGIFPNLVGRIRHGWRVRDELKRTRVSDPYSALERNFWFDTLTHAPRLLRALSAYFGPSRFVLGSDAPFDMGDPDPLASLELAFPDLDDRSRVAAAGACLLTPQPAATRSSNGESDQAPQ
jgi:aminocarboxymuconate-semialdehyde decarboxylase